MCISKILSLPLQMESWASCLGVAIFSYSRGNCIFFFQCLIYYFFNLVSHYLFTSQGESLSVLDMDFFAKPSLILSHLELSRIDFPKLTSRILMEFVTIPVALVDDFYFYMHHPIKTWLFDKITFELVYLWILIYS